MNCKKLVLSALALGNIAFAFAGGILTNTNQSARFARLMALEASTKADAAYYNPAGTVKLGEGFHFTFSNQSAFQERIITSEFLPMTGTGSKEYVGKASAPVIPSLQGVYRKGKWALSGSLAIVGGGGKATFENGLPMFEAPMSTLPLLVNNMVAPALQNKFPGSTLSSKGYSVTQYMTGSNYIFGGQIGGAYKINEMFSVYGGFRLNVVHNKYEGYLKDLKIGITSEGLPILPNMQNQMISPSGLVGYVEENAPSLIPADLVDQIDLVKKAGADGAYLDSKQSGWGIAPIIGAHFSYNGLNIGAKYEFKASLNVENKTTKDDTGRFGPGVNTAHDVPAMFAIGASYDILPQLTANLGYHYFFDKDAGMASNKQKHLTGGTNEYLAGVEYRINDMFLISTGGQITRYGLADDFQSDLSFYVNSYSLGFGGAVNVSKNVQINIGYFFTDYSDYTKVTANANSTPFSQTDTYTRKNKVFTAGVDFSF